MYLTCQKKRSAGSVLLIKRGDQMLIHSIFYPFEMVLRRKQGKPLQPFIHGQKYTGRTNSKVTSINSHTVLDGTRQHVFVTNRDVDTAAAVTVGVTYRLISSLESAEILTDPDAKGVASINNQDFNKSHPFDKVEERNGNACFNAPTLSSVVPTLEVDP